MKTFIDNLDKQVDSSFLDNVDKQVYSKCVQIKKNFCCEEKRRLKNEEE